MLEILRQGANTWLAKLLLAILAASFVLLFGPGSFSRIGGPTNLATVGGTAITPADFQTAYETELAQLSQRARRRITPEEARAYGLDRRVMSRLVGTTALDNQAQQLGLALSLQQTADALRNDPGFKGIDGKFDRPGFDNFLRQIGMTERAFLDLKRKEDVRGELTNSLVDAIVTPKTIIDTMYAWNEETRILDYIDIDADKAVTVAEPDAAKLKETFDANKAQFVAPEYRKLQILLLSITELMKSVPVSDEEIAQSYEQTKEGFATPELRRIQQIPFPDKAAADAAKAAIDAGKNFMTVAQDQGVKESDIDLGLVSKKSLIDKKIADAAFALPRDAVSPVIEGTFRTVLLRVPEIKPGTQQTLEQAKDRVREKLARAKAKDDLQKLRDQVDDMRNAAKSDKEIADALKLKLVEVPETDANGKTAAGAAALDLPDAGKLIASGFDAKSGIDRDPVELADGGYGWVTSLAATPSRQKTYEEVEPQVKALYFTTERKRLVQDLAAKLVERLNAGEAIDAVAADAHAKAEKTPAITRRTSLPSLSDAAVTQAFALPQGRAGSAETTNKKTRSVFRVAEIIPAAPATKEQADKLRAEITQQVQVDTIDAYVAALQDLNGVSINEAALRRMTGPAQSQ